MHFILFYFLFFFKIRNHNTSLCFRFAFIPRLVGLMPCYIRRYRSPSPRQCCQHGTEIIHYRAACVRARVRVCVRTYSFTSHTGFNLHGSLTPRRKFPFPESFKVFPIKSLIDSLSWWHKFLVEDPLTVKKTNEHQFDFGFAHSRFLGARRFCSVPLPTLAFCLGVVLQKFRYTFSSWWPVTLLLTASVTHICYCMCSHVNSYQTNNI